MDARTVVGGLLLLLVAIYLGLALFSSTGRWMGGDDDGK